MSNPTIPPIYDALWAGVYVAVIGTGAAIVIAALSAVVKYLAKR